MDFIAFCQWRPRMGWYGSGRPADSQVRQGLYPCPAKSAKTVVGALEWGFIDVSSL